MNITIALEEASFDVDASYTDEQIMEIIGKQNPLDAKNAVEVSEWHSAQGIPARPVFVVRSIDRVFDHSACMGFGADVARIDGLIAYEFETTSNALMFKLTFGGAA